MALKNGSVNLALGLFDYLKKKEQPIRQHYFWPLFVAKSKQNDLEGTYYYFLYCLYNTVFNSTTLIKNIYFNPRT